MALDRPLNSADASQYQLGRGKARYNGARPTVERLVIGSLQYWFNEGVKDVFAGVPSRTGTETIFYGADGQPLTPVYVKAGAPTVNVARGPTVRVAPAYNGTGKGGGVYINSPSPGSPNDSYKSTVIGPDSATMAIGPHGEVLTDLLPLFLLLAQNGRGQSAPPPPYYGGYPPEFYSGGYPQDFPPYRRPY